MKAHYVYRITNTKINRHYYGVRTSKCLPKDDLGVNYFSSSSDNEFMDLQKQSPSIFKYKVISIFKNRKDAIKMEIKLHDKFNVGINESFYNKAKQTSIGFDTSGTRRTFTDEHILNISLSHKGKTPSLANRIATSKANKNKTKSGETKKKISNTMQREIIKRAQGIHINIYDDEDMLVMACVDYPFTTFCKKHSLPISAFVDSHMNNGKKLYQTTQSVTRAKRLGNDKFTGWYAINEQ